MVSAARPSIVVRRPRFDYAAIDRHWLGQSPVATHIANGLNLLFPWGERFFVRSVSRYRHHLSSEHERADVRAFFAQETAHAAEHERFFEILEAQGFAVQPYLRWYERWAARIERITPPVLRLSTTAAAEHFTATFAEAALADGLLDSAHPAVRNLLLWHAAEEIEHKAVAFDVLMKVSPAYPVRVLGLLIASATLGTFWICATRNLLRQEGLSRRQIRAELRRLRRSGFLKSSRVRGSIRHYLRRDFHPWQRDNAALAEQHVSNLAEAATA